MTHAATLKSQRRQSAKDALLDATERVALRDGINRLTLDAVAAEVGVTKQGLLYHFASKDELVFALFIREWRASAQAIHDAVARTQDGASALEAIIATYVGRYAGRLELFRLNTQHVQQYDARDGLSPQQIAEVRPLNDLMYGEAERKLAADQRRGLLPKSVAPRRLAFSAHLAAMGILAMKALVERFDDPLRHSDEALVAEMCGVFRRSSEGGRPWTK